MNFHGGFVFFLNLFHCLDELGDLVACPRDSPSNLPLPYFSLFNTHMLFSSSYFFKNSANRFTVFLKLLNPSSSCLTPSNVSLVQKVAPKFAPKNPPLTGIIPFKM